MEESAIRLKWKSKFETELKGIRLEEKLIQIEEGIHVDPLYFKKGNESKINMAPIQMWKLGEILASNMQQDEKSLKPRVIEALEHGVEIFWVENSSDVAFLLEGVFTDMIDFYSKADDPGFWINARNTAQTIPVYFDHDIAPTNALIKALEECIFIYKHQKTIPILFFTASDDFVLNIATLQSLRLLIANVAKQEMLPQEVSIFAIMDTKDPSFSEKSIIANTVKSVACLLGGVDAIFNNPHEDTKKGRTIARNIHYLLKEESSLGEYRDALTGNPLFEDIIIKMCSKVWNSKFQGLFA